MFMLRMRRAAVAATAAGLLLVLSGCGAPSVSNKQSFLGGGLARPSVVAISAFDLAPDVVKVDTGVGAKLKRKLQGTTLSSDQLAAGQRVKQVLTDTVLADLQAAGFPVAPGIPDLATSDAPTMRVGGRIQAIDEGNKTKRSIIGFGAGMSKVVVDVQVTHVSSAGKKEVMTFTVEADSPRRPGAIVTSPAGRAAGAAVSAAITVSGVASEKLSADVVAEAKRVGGEIAKRIIAWSAEQGWAYQPGG